MRDDLFAELVESVREGGDILRGRRTPSRTVEAAWRREVAERVVELDEGRARTEPWDEVRRRLRDRLRNRR